MMTIIGLDVVLSVIVIVVVVCDGDNVWWVSFVKVVVVVVGCSLSVVQSTGWVNPPGSRVQVGRVRVRVTVLSPLHKPTPIDRLMG